MNPILQYFILPILPILFLVSSGILLIITEFFSQWKMQKLKLAIAVMGALGALIAAVLLSKNLMILHSLLPEIKKQGAWLIQFVQMYNFDFYSVCFFSAISLFTLFSLVQVNLEFEKSAVRTEVFALILFAAAGMMLLVSANNLIMAFLGLELMSLPVYVLVGIRRKDKNSTEAALKYFLFGSFATVLLVFGIALLYAQFGSLQIPILITRIQTLVTHSSAATESSSLSASSVSSLGLLIASMCLIVIAAGFKVGLVPFHMWLPDVYQGSPTAITGFMGSCIKLAGFGLVARLMWGLFLPILSYWSTHLAIFSLVTIFVGNLAALVQDNLKRMFAYSSISHAGFLMLGISSMANATANQETLFYYLIVYGLMFLGLFAILGIVEKKTGSTEIFCLSGMGFTHPILSLGLSFFALSAAGIPPTAGFFAKYLLFFESVKMGFVSWVVLAVVGSLIGVYYYLRVLVYLYMKEPKEVISFNAKEYRFAYIHIGICLLGLLYFSLRPM